MIAVPLRIGHEFRPLGWHAPDVIPFVRGHPRSLIDRAKSAALYYQTRRHHSMSNSLAMAARRRFHFPLRFPCPNTCDVQSRRSVSFTSSSYASSAGARTRSSRGPGYGCRASHVRRAMASYAGRARKRKRDRLFTEFISRRLALHSAALAGLSGTPRWMVSLRHRRNTPHDDYHAVLSVALGADREIAMPG